MHVSRFNTAYSHAALCRAHAPLPHPRWLRHYNVLEKLTLILQPMKAYENALTSLVCSARVRWLRLSTFTPPRTLIRAFEIIESIEGSKNVTSETSAKGICGPAKAYYRLPKGSSDPLSSYVGLP